MSGSYVSAPVGGGPGVLVLHAWWGLSDGVRQVCDRLAGEGFVALAPDLCAGRTAPADALAELRRHPAVRGQLGAVGFSMGVLYYGTAGGIDHTRHRAAVLGHFAERDEWEPQAEVASLEDELRHAGRAVRFHVYPGAGHWFAEADRPEAYDRATASLAFRRTVGFLRTQLQTFAPAPLQEW